MVVLELLWVLTLGVMVNIPPLYFGGTGSFLHSEV